MAGELECDANAIDSAEEDPSPLEAGFVPMIDVVIWFCRLVIFAILVVVVIIAGGHFSS